MRVPDVHEKDPHVLMIEKQAKSWSRINEGGGQAAEETGLARQVPGAALHKSRNIRLRPPTMKNSQITRKKRGSARRKCFATRRAICLMGQDIEAILNPVSSLPTL